MSLISISPELATLTLNDETITDFTAGDYITLEPMNEATQQIYASGGSMSESKHVASDVYTLTFNIMRYSDSDNFMQQLLNQSEIQIINGSIKETYEKDGKELVATYDMLNGTFTTRPSFSHNNEDGNAEVAYTIVFRSMTRTL